MPLFCRPRAFPAPGVHRSAAMLCALAAAAAWPGSSAAAAAGADTGHLNTVVALAETAPDEDGAFAWLIGRKADYLPAQARAAEPASDIRDLAFGPDATLYAADTANHVVLAIDTEAGDIDIVAGVVDVAAGEAAQGFTGDGGPATQARLAEPHSVAVGPEGTVYISDSGNHRIRAVDPEDGTIHTVAGGGSTALGDGRATDLWLHDPHGIGIGPDGLLYIAENGADRIRALDLDHGTLATVAGRPGGGEENVPDEDDPEAAEVEASQLGEEVDLSEAVIREPSELTVAADGTLYLLDTPVGGAEPRQLRAIRLRPGTVTTLQAEIYSPRRVAVGGDGALYLANAPHHHVGVMDPAVSGPQVPGVSAVLGDDEVWQAWLEDGSSPVDAPPSDRGDAPDEVAIEPGGLAVADDGTLYVADTAHGRILALGDGLEEAHSDRSLLAVLGVTAVVAGGILLRRRRTRPESSVN